LPLFEGMNVQVLGISVDHIPCLKAWAESLGGITYPLLSDFWPHGAVAMKYGVLRSEGYTERAIFIIDPAGVIRYIDIHDIDDQPSNEVLFEELAKISPQARKVVEQRRSVSGGVQDLPHGGVVMYCTSWCPSCRNARAWLKEHNIPYSEVDIERTPGAAAQVRKWANGNQTTPTFDINGTIVVDFDVARLTELLLKK
jgi:glutaredoxin